MYITTSVLLLERHDHAAAALVSTAHDALDLCTQNKIRRNAARKSALEKLIRMRVTS